MNEFKIDLAECRDNTFAALIPFQKVRLHFATTLTYHANRFLFVVFPLDVDECEADLAECGESAYCTNTVGSYICNCKSGYAGIGNECNGA